METYSGDEESSSAKVSFFGDFSCCDVLDGKEVFSLCGDVADLSVIEVFDLDVIVIDIAWLDSAGLVEPLVVASIVTGAKGGVAGTLRFFRLTSGGPDMPEIEGAELPIESVRERA